MNGNLLEAIVQRPLFYPSEMDQRFSDLPRREWSGMPGVFTLDQDVAAIIASHGLWRHLTEQTGMHFDLFEDVLIDSTYVTIVAQSIIDFAERYRGRDAPIREAVGSVTVGESEVSVVVETSTRIVEQALQRLSDFLQQRSEEREEVVASL